MRPESSDRVHLFSVRWTIAKRSRNIRPGASRAAVLGGGLLGLEAARGMLNRGLEAHVIQLSNRPMNVQLDAPAGEVLKGTLERMGVKMHTGKTTTRYLESRM